MEPSTNLETNPSIQKNTDETEQQLSRWGRLHSFCLPDTLLNGLIPRRKPLPASKTSSTPSQPTHQAEIELGTGTLACLVCKTQFEDPVGQRSHFKSDWHRYNIKRDRRGGEALKESDFLIILEGLEDSLSGSEDESSSETSDDDDDGDQESELTTLRSGAQTQQNSPLIWFTAPSILGDGVQFGIYRCILPRFCARKSDHLDQNEVKHDEERLGVLKELTQLQVTPRPGPSSKAGGNDEDEGDPSLGRKWTMLMVSGGHFAGMVVRTRPELRHLGKGKAPEKEISILEHKTFHRYTS